MSAAPQLRLADYSPAAPHWISVADLAAALGISARSVMRYCKDDLELGRCHRYKDNPNGGPKLIEIDLTAPTCPEKYRTAVRQASQRNAGELGAAHILTEHQMARAGKIAGILQEVETHLAGTFNAHLPERQRIEKFLDWKRAMDPGVFSLASYYNHKKKWLAGGRKLSALADGRSDAGQGVKAEFTEAAIQWFAGLYLTQDDRRFTECYKKLTREAQVQGWIIPSLQTVKRTIKARYSSELRTLLQEGTKAHNDRCLPYAIRDWSQMQANEFWVSDHCELDVIGLDDLPGATAEQIGRPARMWLTWWLDEACRYVISWRIHRGPNTRQVMASIFQGILAEGIPDNVRIDNGKEFRCARFAGGRNWKTVVERLAIDEPAVRPICFDLGITPHFANPYNARAKIIEPAHNHFIKNQFSKFVPGYCGGNSQEKPEQLAALVKRWETHGDGLLPWSQLCQYFAQAVDTYHMERKPSLGGNCPAYLRQQKLATRPKRLADPRTAALFMEARELTCASFLSIDGANYGLGNLTLIEHQGEKIRVRLDEQNAGRVYVYDKAGRYLTTAENAGRIAAAATREELEAGLKKLAHARKVQRAAMENAPALASIDPAALFAQRIMPQHPLALAAGDAPPNAPDSPPTPLSFKPDFSPRADDGSLLPAAPRPAPAALPPAETSTLDPQVSNGTDSVVPKKESPMTRNGIWDLLDSGQ